MASQTPRARSTQWHQPLPSGGAPFEERDRSDAHAGGVPTTNRCHAEAALVNAHLPLAQDTVGRLSQHSENRNAEDEDTNRIALAGGNVVAGFLGRTQVKVARECLELRRVVMMGSLNR